jgi:hypothetical protein
MIKKTTTTTTRPKQHQAAIKPITAADGQGGGLPGLRKQVEALEHAINVRMSELNDRVATLERVVGVPELPPEPPPDQPV